MQLHLEGSGPAIGARDAPGRHPDSATSYDEATGQTEPAGGGEILLPLFVGSTLLMVGAIVLVADLGSVWMLVVASSLEVVVIAAGVVWLLALLANNPLLRPRGFARGTMAGVTVAPAGGWHQVLVIANRGLEDPELCAEVCSRGTRSQTGVMVIAPVVASSRLRSVTGDIHLEQRVAQGRIDVGLQTLLSKGVKAQGHTVVGQPMTSLLDGLREFPASEVVMLNGGEVGWIDASTFAERVRSRFGIRVTEVNPSPGSAHHIPPGLDRDSAPLAVAAAPGPSGSDRPSP
jgi:hypothetical protein